MYDNAHVNHVVMFSPTWLYSVPHRGWLGTSFIPEHARMFFDPLETGARGAGRSLADIDLQVNAGVVAFSDDLERLIAPRKPGLAFTGGENTSQYS